MKLLNVLMSLKHLFNVPGNKLKKIPTCTSRQTAKGADKEKNKDVLKNNSLSAIAQPVGYIPTALTQAAQAPPCWVDRGDGALGDVCFASRPQRAANTSVMMWRPHSHNGCEERRRKRDRLQFNIVEFRIVYPSHVNYLRYACHG